MASRLKPCPFCGNNPEMRTVKWITSDYVAGLDNAIDVFYVVCHDISCRRMPGVYCYETEDAAIKAWNKIATEERFLRLKGEDKNDFEFKGKYNGN